MRIILRALQLIYLCESLHDRTLHNLDSKLLNVLRHILKPDNGFPFASAFSIVSVRGKI